MKIADLHVHTNYSFDSRATMEAHVEHAIEMGLDVLCFSDHVECGAIYTAYEDFEFAKRAEHFARVKKQYQNDIKLLLGVEFGEPHLHPTEFNYVKSLNLDMIIGSIHYPLDLMLNSGDSSKNRYYEQMYREYLFDMVSHGGFDVVGHMDMAKRYNDDYVANDEMLRKTLDVVVKNGLIPEMNTSTIRRKNLPPMIDLEMVKYYQSIGGKYVTINSDAHTVPELASDIKQTALTLPDGIKRCYFENRKLVELD